MGMIEKQIRKHGNQKLAAPMVTLTTLNQDQVVAAIRKICWDYNTWFNQQYQAHEAMRRKPRGRWNQIRRPEFSHYYVEVAPTAILVSYSRPASVIAAYASSKKVSRLAGYLLAIVRFPNNIPCPPGSIAVQLRLSKWLMDGNTGKLTNQAKYEWFADALAAVLRPV